MFSKLALRNVRRSFRDYGVYLLTLTFGVCLFYTFNSIEGQGAMIYLSKSENPMVESIFMLVDIFSVFVAVVLACLILYANRFLLRRRKRVLASYGLSALTLSMFSMDVSSLLGLTFSLKAAGKTVLYFGLIFLLVMAFSGLEVSRAKLIDLIQGGRKNEVLKQRSLTAAVVQFILGVVCLLAAYAILLTFGMAIAVAILPICIPMLSLGTLGTLLIFRSLSGFVMKFAQGHPKFYYKNLNLFTLRQWISKVHSTYLSQTVICILLLLAMGITASCLGLNSTLETMTDQQAPFDITVQNQSADWSGPVDFSALLEENNFDKALLAWQYDVTFYYNDPSATGIEEASAAIRVSDYNALLERQGKPPYSGGLPWLQEDWNQALSTGNLGLTYVVVPDEMAQRLEIRRQVWSADYAGNQETTENALLQIIRPLNQEVSLRVGSRLMIYQDIMGNKILALFLGLYLGFTFLLAAAAVLALQQLSQAADNSGRYAILRRLGAEEKLVARSATHQVALAFLLPLGLALVHSAVGMKAANDLISAVGKVDSVQSSLITAFMLLAVYGGYFLATALACRRMARSA